MLLCHFRLIAEKLSKRYKDYDGELHLIELTKGDKGLGLR